MTASISLVSKFLSESQKLEIAVNLASDLSNPESAAFLCELIGQLGAKTVDQIYPQLLAFTKKTSLEGDELLRNSAIQFILQSPALCNDILDYAHQELNKGITTHFGFVSGYSEMVDAVQKPDATEAAKEDILNLFEFLSLLFTKAQIPSTSAALSTDKLLCLFLGHKDDDISASCSKLIRWRVKSLVDNLKTDQETAKFLWDIVFELISTGKSKRHQANAFIMWLRVLNSENSELKSNSYFQRNIINQDFYWEVLQRGLVSNSHEIRKFCLSILQLSLKSIGSSFITKTLAWDTANESRLFKDWSRYTTLFEILGIDTSLHQTQAAVNDILALISKDSLIHPSWGFCLLSTGFQASMDSVRKYSMQILLSIEQENLQLIRYGLPFLENTFLPYMMLSRHFAVRSLAGNKLYCPYGEKYSQFLTQLMKSLTTPEEYLEVAFSILSVLDTARESFDAVKIYTALGLLNGLESKKMLQFGKHDKLVSRLFDNFSEGELYKTTVQTLNLKLLLQFKLELLEPLIAILSQFNSFNGYQIFSDHIESIATYINESGFTREDLQNYYISSTSEDAKVILVWIISSKVFGFDEKLESIILKESDLFIALLIASGLSITELSASLINRVRELLTQASSNNLDSQTYSALEKCEVDISRLDETQPSLTKLYEAIKEDSKSDDYGVLSVLYSKFNLLNKFVSAFGLSDLKLTSNDFEELKKILFCNSSKCAKTVTDFYKLKEAVMGEFHKLLASFVHHSQISDEQFTQIFDLLTFGSTHFSTLFSIGSILTDVYDRELINDVMLEKTVEGLSESIEELNSERFKLSDKALHTLLIEVMLHPFVLKSTTSIESVNNFVASFCQSMLANSLGRRGIFTRLMKMLSKFQISNSATFEQVPFVPEFLVRAACHRQLQHSAFKLETVIGELYDSQLSVTQTNIYAEIYGVEEVAAKVWTLTILNSIKTPTCAQAIIDRVFNEEDDFGLFNIVKATDGVEEFTRTQLMKTVLSVADKVDVDYSVEHYFQHYTHIVENDPSPLVRVYVEWLIANVLLKKPELSDLFFDKLVSSLETHEMKPTLVTTYERILYLMIQSMDNDDEVRFLAKLVAIIIPAASTNKAITRHFSMSLATSVYQEVRKKKLVLEPSLNSIVDNMYRSALASDAFGQYRSGDALLWNIVDDLNLVNISGGLLLRLFDRDVEFLTEEDFDKYLNGEQKRLLTHPVGLNQKDLWVSELKNVRSSGGAFQESSDISQSPLQTKSGAWSTVMDVDEGGHEVVRSDLIVVASLVDKPPNLGGICRLCDVLGAGTMTLHDFKVKNHAQFKSVAVTADYWMPMIEVKPESIATYLREQKANGYTLIGLEQTDKSVVLDSKLEFPKKSLILLGREKEGIPGELLAELDFCVEINQVGVIRSMNIQTATAVIVHAYSSQHC